MVETSSDYFTASYTWKTFEPNEDRPNGRWTIRNYNDRRATNVTTRPDRVRTRKPTGWLFPKPYSTTISSYRPPFGRIEWSKAISWLEIDPNTGNRITKRGIRREIMEGYLASAVDRGQRPVLPASSSNLRRSAEIKALMSLKDQRVNLGVALAEAQQTADFIGTTLANLAKSVRDARKGNFRKAMQSAYGGRHTLKSIPRKWIEYQYALNPLLGDIAGALEALAKRDQLTDWVVSVKGSARESSKGRESLGSNDQEARTQVWMDTVTTLGYFVRLDYCPSRYFLHHLSSLGVTNPAEIAWEKVPFSFVVDWALPIGEWFSTFDATVGFEFLSGSCSERKEAHCKWSHHMMSYPDIIPGPCHVSGSARTFSLNRTVYSGTPVITAPRVKNPLSLGHLANGLSLLALAFGRKG